MASILDCKKIQAVLSEYIDGTLTPTEAQAAKQHLASCAVCAKIVEELTQTSRLLAFLPRNEPSDRFQAQLAARLANQRLRPRPTTPAERLSAWWIRPLVRPAVASGLAVAALVPVAFFLLRPGDTEYPETTTSVAEGGTLDQVMQDHLSATTSEAFGNSSGLLLASARNDMESGS